MHAAKLESSDRLQRVLAVLKDGRPKTTRQIIREADVCAVSAIAAELRAQGIPIQCKRIRRGVYEYSLGGHVPERVSLPGV